eukprot:3845248-Rhodomonas_salina.1
MSVHALVQGVLRHSSSDLVGDREARVEVRQLRIRLRPSHATLAPAIPKRTRKQMPLFAPVQRHCYAAPRPTTRSMSRSGRSTSGFSTGYRTANALAEPEDCTCDAASTELSRTGVGVTWQHHALCEHEASRGCSASG